jgi:GntR family transcriptional regulator, transcriptional repressor for pyruvate dehydrogenase complex
LAILGDQIAARLLDEIVAGIYAPGSPLPSEAELARREGVSRLTIREALKVLREKSVVDVQRGRGSFVNERSQWNPIDPVVLKALSSSPDAFEAHVMELYEARRLVETGTAELAAIRRSEGDVEAMQAALDRGRESIDDLKAFVQADLDFHNAIMHGVGNAVLGVLFDPIVTLLRDARRETSRDRGARERAIIAHQRILDAIRERRPERARWAMHEHLAEGVADFGATHPQAPAPGATTALWSQR